MIRARAATPEDVAEVAAIERACFGDPWSEASFRGTFANEGAVAFVAERAGRVVGYCFAWTVVDEAELANLAVAPEARRQGIGALLLDTLLRALEARGCATVFLEVRATNEAAMALYASRGFAVSGRRKGYYRAPVEDAVLMRRAR